MSKLPVRTISKSQYYKGRHCLKRVWLYNYRKDLMEPPSPFQKAIMVQGTEVGKLARNLFPNGILIEEDYKNLTAALARTREAINKNVEAIFEGAFIFDNIVIRVDILKRNDDGSFDLIEVKSSTKLKKEHLPDCAVQAFVLKNLGFNIRNVCIMYLNREYKRQGEIDLTKLYVIKPINSEVQEELDNVPQYLNKINCVLGKNEEPFWRIGSICNNPYVCEFKHYCWRDVDVKSIHFITNITENKRQKLVDLNINLIKDVPEDFRLTEIQQIQVSCEKLQTKHVEHNPIKVLLSQLRYPLYFLDFETYGFAIPKFEGTQPYQHLPFQYSLHIKRDLNSELKHYEFIFEENENPSRALAQHLIEHIGEIGSVIVYYAEFEGSRLKEMANEYPDLAPKLLAIHARIWDLYIPFSNRWYCDPAFNGSASIKNVLPVLVPSLSYDGLEIQKGDEAQLKYVEMINSWSEYEKHNIKMALLKYCELDTLAMVYILNALEDIVRNSENEIVLPKETDASMTKIEINESLLVIDEKLVQKLVATQFPKWKKLSVRAIEHQGWDNRTFRLGEDMLVRMPSGSEYSGQVEKEHRWLPKLAPFLPLKIPSPLAIGEPAFGFPWKWGIYRWIPGESASTTLVNNLDELATKLAEFLLALHKIETKDGPVAGSHSFHRGGSLSAYDTETKKAISVLKDKINAKAAMEIWKNALATRWTKPSVWVHGDISAGNLLIQNGQLSAVIDFGQLAVGDPACDLVIAWTLFKDDSRKIFQTVLSLDKETWERGRAWALWKFLTVTAGFTQWDAIEARKPLLIIQEIITDYGRGL